MTRIEGSIIVVFSRMSMDVNISVTHICVLYNLQLVAESLKAKQMQASLLAEKQVLASRVQHANATADHHKQRVSRLEDQVYLMAWYGVIVLYEAPL